MSGPPHHQRSKSCAGPIKRPFGCQHEVFRHRPTYSCCNISREATSNYDARSKHHFQAGQLCNDIEERRCSPLGHDSRGQNRYLGAFQGIKVVPARRHPICGEEESRRKVIQLHDTQKGSRSGPSAQPVVADVGCHEKKYTRQSLGT